MVNATIQAIICSKFRNKLKDLIMKTTPFVLLLLLATVFLIGTSCNKNNDDDSAADTIVPSSFKVDIPSSVSHANTLKSTNGGQLRGNEIYEHMSNFIRLGEAAAEVVEEIMKSIVKHGINKPMDLTYTSGDDGKTKHLIVVDNAEFEGNVWQHQLTITDLDSEGNKDKGNAMQVFWNTNPVKGIAILKPYNIDRTHNLNVGQVLYRIDYSEDDNYYDATMLVQIAGWEEDYADRFHIDNVKMFAGKKGDIVNVFGNSNHPDAYLLDTAEVGFDWAFVASARYSQNIGVAEVGLPFSILNSNERKAILEDNSIKNTLSRQLTTLYGSAISQAIIDAYLVNVNPPAYFGDGGFVSAGTSPGIKYDPLAENIKSLIPYNPSTISSLTLSFK